MSLDREIAVPDCLSRWYASNEAIPLDTTIAELSWRDPWISE